MALSEPSDSRPVDVRSGGLRIRLAADAAELAAAQALRPWARAERYVAMDSLAPGAVDRKEALRALPPLIKGYLRLGGMAADILGSRLRSLTRLMPFAGFALPLGSCPRPLFAWYGDMDLVPHLWQLAGLRRLTMAVHFHRPETLAEFGLRKALSRY